MRFLKSSLLLLISTSCWATDYTAAIDTAKTAFLIQSGIQSQIDMVYAYGTKEAYRYAEKLGIEKEARFGVAIYEAYDKKSITIPVNKNKDLTLTPNSATLTIRY